MPDKHNRAKFYTFYASYIVKILWENRLLVPFTVVFMVMCRMTGLFFLIQVTPHSLFFTFEISVHFLLSIKFSTMLIGMIRTDKPVIQGFIAVRRIGTLMR